jgi:hypothetical protein
MVGAALVLRDLVQRRPASSRHRCDYCRCSNFSQSGATNARAGVSGVILLSEF